MIGCHLRLIAHELAAHVWKKLADSLVGCCAFVRYYIYHTQAINSATQPKKEDTMQHSAAYTRAEEPCWTGLYRTAGVAAMVTAVVIVLGVVVFLVWPPATVASVAEWFAHFQTNALRGLLDLDLLMLLGNLAAIPIWVASFVALWRTSPSLTALAAPLGLVGAATYFASSRLFEMLALSSQYAAATSATAARMLEAAGQSMLTTYLGAFAATTGTAPAFWSFQGTAFNVSFALTASGRHPYIGRHAAQSGLRQAGGLRGAGGQRPSARPLCAAGRHLALGALTPAATRVVCAPGAVLLAAWASKFLVDKSDDDPNELHHPDNLI